MSHHSIIAGLCFFLMLATILFAMFRSVAETDRRPIKPPAWFKCLACGVYECEDGRQQFRPPITASPDPRFMRFRVRECTDCKGAAAQLIKSSKAPLIFVLACSISISAAPHVTNPRLDLNAKNTSADETRGVAAGNL